MAQSRRGSQDLTMSQKGQWGGGLSAVVFLSICWAIFQPQVSPAAVYQPGTFQGLIRSDSMNDESFGFFSLTLTTSGTFSMRFNLGVNRIGRHSYAKTGRFDENGAYHFEGPEPLDNRYADARFIDLQLEPADNPVRIRGVITDLTHTSTLEAELLSVFPIASPAPQAGRYTFLFWNPGNPGVPNGYGFGSMIVHRNGRITAGGRAPDGRTFSQSAALTVSGRWPVFARLGGSTGGILSGWLNFADTLESDFAGGLTWLGPEVPGPNNAFVPAFAGEMTLVGSRYQYTPQQPLLQVGPSTNNIQLEVSGGGLNQPIDRLITLTPANRIIFSPRLPGDSLYLSAGSGLFSGTFLNSDNFITPFRGAVLQKQNIAGGFFVDRTGESGTVTLTPIN